MGKKGNGIHIMTPKPTCVLSSPSEVKEVKNTLKAKLLQSSKQ